MRVHTFDCHVFHAAFLRRQVPSLVPTPQPSEVRRRRMVDFLPSWFGAVIEIAIVTSNFT